MPALREELQSIGIPNDKIGNYELISPNKTGLHINYYPRNQATCGFYITDSYVDNNLIIGLNKWGFLPSQPYRQKVFFVFDNAYPRSNIKPVNSGTKTINVALFLGNEIRINPFTYRTVIEPFMGKFNDPSPEPNVTRASLLLMLFFHRLQQAPTARLRQIWNLAKMPRSFNEWVIAFDNYDRNIRKLK
ncbi:hypothetical protein [Xenorhabdus bovienii]|uniref:hypothetical protein n=1 Tax=Xenorhabdus bovienii TaxID=40576 RepID=UPI003DA2534F